MTIVIAHGGLCNRLIEINSAVLLSRKKKSRKKNRIIVIWPLDYSLNCKSSRLFEVTDKNITILNCSPKVTRRVRRVLLAMKILIHMPEHDELENAKKKLETKRLVGIETDQTLVSGTGFEWYTPSIHILQKVDAVVSRYNKQGKTIGLHIRRTDHKRAIENSPTECFLEKMKSLEAEQEYITYFLATDDPDERKAIQEATSKEVITIDNQSYLRNQADNIEAAMVDLLCLSKCDMLLGSYGSTFSRLASWTNNKPELIVMKK